MNKWPLAVLLISVFMVIGLAILAWLNRGSTEVVKLTYSIAGAAMLAAASILLIFVSASARDRNEIQVVLPAVSGPSMLNWYNPLLHVDVQRGLVGVFTTVFTEFTQRRQGIGNPATIEHTSGSFFLDAMELIVLNWLSRTYPGHWRTERDFFSGTSSGAGSIRAREDANQFGKSHLSPNDVKRHLAANVLISTGVSVDGLELPRGSRLEAERKDGVRTLRLKNRNMVLEIQISHRGGGLLGSGLLTERLAEYLGRPADLVGSQVWLHYFVVKFDRRFTRICLWSPDTIAQREWASEAARLFEEDFEWRRLKGDLERALADPAVRARRGR